jgi:predicted CXXCH cytochrome family protein
MADKGVYEMKVITTMFLMLAIVFAATGQTPPTSAQKRERNVDHDTHDYHRGVIGSKHDFTDSSGRFGNACNACHIPHVQAIRPTTRPSTQPAVEMFRIAGQRKVFVPGRYTPGPTSLICLGCHDGTVATSAIGSSHAMLATVREGFNVPDGFVWRDHPIGIAYPSDRREYHPEAFAVAKNIRLPEGRIECISCHDPHNELGIDGMLQVSNRRSALCLTCHIK